MSQLHAVSSQAVGVCFFFLLPIDLFFINRERPMEDGRETGKQLLFSNRPVFTGSGVWSR